jgi:hypothetical protein
MKLGGQIKTSALATKTVSLEGGSKDDMDHLMSLDTKYFRVCKIKDR